MTDDDDFAMEGLKSLRRAVAEALERKRLPDYRSHVSALRADTVAASVKA